ncbi:xylulose 5-phosphate 3-epimerase [Pseudomarimonas arenosa]|uniref:Xylulose 5-phosphate 3-epimerase n=1 Tax=Pseudomarimonas arenosa TaxID=2774145 RepID=A0AAW3ZJB6_9GAMM|nr:xylulose 5-phosphate 3-epimerase [Pseudomarimonas arenosa]MBD8524406.1 xylulose 5-phosphate 3-epimerase [Pseudomarimonas arenosa]
MSKIPPQQPSGTLGCRLCDDLPEQDRSAIEQAAAAWRSGDPLFARWAAGYGVIRHDPLTQQRIGSLLETRVAPEQRSYWLERLIAADRLASAGLWLVAHMTYARRVRRDGTPLPAEAFKPTPEGHTGGSLNMVPAYVGYLLANALSGDTRGWIMGQGHCVAAIDAVNLWVGNTHTAHAERYDLGDDGLSRFVSDFYSYAIDPDGRPASPLGSHVNAHTAGGVSEGGYLGFAELLWPHMPLKGERLVAFLSDGAFEEQRGSDWAPRWWRAEDSGLVAPIMILNGRRIEQRSSIAQQGGERWLHRHLRLNGFEPIGLDGRDPASMAWGILEMESRLQAAEAAPARLGYAIAEAPKGFGFPGAGSNRAHNLPLEGNPSRDPDARDSFNAAARALWVAEDELHTALSTLRTHAVQQRPLERDHVLACRDVDSPKLGEPAWRPVGSEESPMAALDEYVVRVIDENPQLRPRVGNPDELRSNRLDRTLDTLKHRVALPEPGVAESLNGAVITALNEEAVICAALGNKGGINLAVTYEAFGMKMLGALRQEIIFARHLTEAGRPPGWISVPLFLTSHTWENAKNEQSHQDPSLVEALLGEMADTSVVRFAADANSALAMLRTTWRSHGRIIALVVPKRAVRSRLTPEQAENLARDGAVVLHGDPKASDLLLIAVGAYQLEQAESARLRLQARGQRVALIYLGEPARLRAPRDAREAAAVWTDEAIEAVFPPGVPRVLMTHTRPEPLLGVLRRIDTGSAHTCALGYINRGGTLSVEGLLFANRCTWAHAVQAAADMLGYDPGTWLSATELNAVAGRGDPRVLFEAPAA